MGSSVGRRWPHAVRGTHLPGSAGEARSDRLLVDDWPSCTRQNGAGFDEGRIHSPVMAWPGNDQAGIRTFRRFNRGQILP